MPATRRGIACKAAFERVAVMHGVAIPLHVQRMLQWWRSTCVLFIVHCFSHALKRLLAAGQQRHDATRSDKATGLIVLCFAPCRLFPACSCITTCKGAAAFRAPLGADERTSHMSRHHLQHQQSAGDLSHWAMMCCLPCIFMCCTDPGLNDCAFLPGRDACCM